MPRTPRAHTEVDSSEQCPCGSGKRYAACCKKRGIKWKRDGRQRLYKSMRVTARVKSGIERQHAEFKKLLGRSIGPGDRVFFQQFIHPDREWTLETIEAMKKAGIPGELIYAYEKTGLILSESNRHHMAREDVAEFQNAIREYRRHGKRIEAERADLDIELKRIQVVFGILIDRFVNARRRIWKDHELHEDFRRYALVSAARNIRAFRILVGRKAEYDALGNLRSLYQNALVYAHLFRYPASAEILLAKVGLRTGSHVYETKKDGKVDYRWLVNQETGERIRADISKARMARSLGDDFYRFHSVIYGKFSEVIHSDIIDWNRHLTDSGIRPYVTNAEGEAYFWLFTVCLFLITEVLLEPRLQMSLRRDMRFLGKRVGEQLLRLTAINSDAGTKFEPVVIAFLDYLFKAIGLLPFENATGSTEHLSADT